MLREVPSLEEIYDLSSSDLESLLIKLSSLNSIQQQQLKSLQEYVSAELEQRRNIHFFTQMLQKDNPYLQKLTDFNHQFVILANEAIQHQKQEISDHMEVQSENMEVQSEHTEIQSVTSGDGSNYQTTKKMGFGMKKKKIPAGKLTTKGEPVTIKSNQQHNRLQVYADERGHILQKGTEKTSVSQRAVPRDKTQQVPEIKTKKMYSSDEKESTIKQRREMKKASPNDHSQKITTKKSIPPKTPCVQTKKNQNLNSFLVQLVREEEQRKRNKQMNQSNALNPSSITEKLICPIGQSPPTELTVHKSEKSLINSSVSPSTSEIKVIDEVPFVEKKPQIQQTAKQVIEDTQPKQEQEVKKEQGKKLSALSIDEVIEEQLENNANTSGDKLDGQIREQITPEDSQINEDTHEVNQVLKQPISAVKTQVTYSTPQLSQNSINIPKISSSSSSKIAQVNGPAQSAKNVAHIDASSGKQETENSACYNQQYWNHIREEAQLKIQRFKQQKELLLAQQHEDEANQMEAVKVAQIAEIAQIADPMDIFVKQKQLQLKKMVNQHSQNNRKVAPKPPVAIPKPIYPRPEFNYLEIYPTFEHIFSAMYTKPPAQAMAELPSIMKELAGMYSTHINHFKEKNFFQPAVFLPFEHSSQLSITDPRQLLFHAENTYVGLKSLVERLEIFNMNLTGQLDNGQCQYYRVVKTKQEVYDIVTTSFLRRKQWKELPHGFSLRSTWNLFWSWSKPDIDLSRLLIWQRVNHFPFNKNLSRKDLLYKNLDQFRKQMKVPITFLPLTFNLPKEFTQFSSKFHEEEMKNRFQNYWIMKPIGKSRGRGIKLINNLADLSYTDNIVVQKYISNPLLIEGYKFDMRIYVLVTSFHPLEAFVYREGFARLSTEKYSMDPMSMKNAFIHLTNFAINKHNVEAKSDAMFSAGSKISIKVLKDKITKMGYSFSQIWQQVHEIIIKSLLGCSVSVPPFPNAFELFGYDIMIDTEGACHLIEINSSPSLQRTYLIDEIIKQSLMDDIFDILEPMDFDKEVFLDLVAERTNTKRKFTAEEDLVAIARLLRYKPLRKIGEIPSKMGLFEMIAPSKMSTDIQKLIRSRSGANNPLNID